MRYVPSSILFSIFFFLGEFCSVRWKTSKSSGEDIRSYPELPRQKDEMVNRAKGPKEGAINYIL